jgi:tetratricopeptide (TPR) repeat protein
MVSQSTVPPNAQGPSRPKGGVTGSIGDFALDIWRRIIDRLAGSSPERHLDNLGPNALYLRARTDTRAGKLETTERRFAELVSSGPGFAPALEAHGEALDMLGEGERAAGEYDKARRLRSQTRAGAPDRCFALRNRRNFIDEVAAYTAVLRTGPDKRRPLTYVARGNAYLAMGYAKLALLDYQLALELNPKLLEINALKGEAWIVLGNHAKAVSAFDIALHARPDDGEGRGGRAIALAALGRLAEADADWRRQLVLLPADRPAARACVSLRLADYAAALPDLERAMERERGDPYWRLYRLTALNRLGRAAESSLAGEAWPGPLLALQAGRLSIDDVLPRADTAERCAEALFQAAVVACPHDRERARSLWTQVVDKAPPTMIEHAAARHELAQGRP